MGTRLENRDTIFGMARPQQWLEIQWRLPRTMEGVVKTTISHVCMMEGDMLYQQTTLGLIAAAMLRAHPASVVMIKRMMRDDIGVPHEDKRWTP